MKMMMFLFMIMLTISFFFLLNPLMLGMVLILQTINMSILFGMMEKSFWFYYILLLVFIGGLLVLFIYMTSIFPNEKITFNQNLFLMLMMIMLIIFFTLIFMDILFNLNLNYFFENMINIKNNNLLMTKKIFSSNTNILLFFLVNYLFYCMIIVIKITNKSMGPLRKMYV